MTDWSEVFEQRLQTVLQDSKAVETAAGFVPGHDLEQTPSSTCYGGGTTQRVAAPTDPTSSFFESIRKQSRSGGGGHYAVGGVTKSQGFQHGEPSRGMFTPAAQVIRTSSPDGMDRAGIKDLQESYSGRAEDLHREATERMNHVRDVLEAELARMARTEDAFLSTVAAKQSRFSQPADAWMVKVQMRDNRQPQQPPPQQPSSQSANAPDGPVEKDERVVDRMAAMRAAAATLEADLARLWAEWGQAHAEVTEVLQAMTGDHGGDDNGDDDNEGQKILDQAEKELSAAAAEAVAEMTENEKTFKKMILAEECKLAQMMLSRQSKYD